MSSPRISPASFVILLATVSADLVPNESRCSTLCSPASLDIRRSTPWNARFNGPCSCSEGLSSCASRSSSERDTSCVSSAERDPLGVNVDGMGTCSSEPDVGRSNDGEIDVDGSGDAVSVDIGSVGDGTEGCRTVGRGVIAAGEKLDEVRGPEVITGVGASSVFEPKIRLRIRWKKPGTEPEKPVSTFSGLRSAEERYSTVMALSPLVWMSR
mmetsp:Transcript_17206/g.35755  ORF Transcript_17206/g.35755 Transcript_17206/m.35755 type:complete len:212 (-) Transcript_17206:3135-3770(-)